ncbi:MBOAT family protein [Mucilaginibacter sp. BJC16-A38]|uniref:MBOAT family O-acyltransferase n=1 Tax=Mucilaginibacter phenanthrenivorans TaxID=1234842 RepID=UPI0021580DB9|nr:MBOAT family O-acyltransferase [Mucilaginibacter phenanthrenivorans]MCR8560184.1 MBOAT family protein [Mucilaginibacter phenanthrenivorans]
MLFNSLLFLFFFIVVTSLYYLLPQRFRWMWLLLSSCYFYMYFKPEYILIIFFTIIVDYLAAIMIDGATGRNKKIFLIISLVTNIGVLCYFKYFNFIAGNFNLLSERLHGPALPLLSMVLPIGLSFHTFQAMSYTIEVYRGNQKPERHFGIYSLYVMFYPQMVAGPIERPQQLLPQLKKEKIFDKKTFYTGIFLMMLGLFKKVVVADRLGILTDPIFSSPAHRSATDLLTATYFFSFQIYCDFSGYTDIAIGAGMTLGIKLMQNFNMPYLASNIAEFWKRWHISLSTWFRDYLYIPLGGSRGNFLRTCINLMVVFLISGLWHGANWKYLIWGLIHGCLLVGYQIFKKLKWNLKGYRWLKWLITFNLVSLAWVFFRANSVSDAMVILSRIFSSGQLAYSAGDILPLKGVYYCVILIAGLIWLEWSLRGVSTFKTSKKVFIALALGLACYLLGVFNEAQFIYFQF